jgi:ABC-type transport system involved in multi-copper enzyme maturation permease subunit
VGTLVAGLSLLGIALRASSSVSGERDRQTWDSILTTPLDSNSILVGKWLGIILSARWSALWLAMIWLMGVITGGLSVLAVPLLAAACAVYAGFLSCMGLWFSTVSRTTMRANVGTLATSLFLAGGYWLFCVSCCFPMIRLGPSGQGITDIVEFQSVGLTPPVTLGFLAFTNDERQSTLGIESRFVTFAIVGVLCWAVMTAIMWGLTSNRFREATGRVIKPRRLAPAEAVSAPIAADES